MLKTQWQFLMDHTDPRYVRAQIDLGWAVSGQQDMVALMSNPTYAARVISFHVKDVVNPRVNAGTADLRALGDGDINFAPIFAAAKNRVRCYLYEYDPVTPGNNGGFNPFTSADKSFAALAGDPAPVAYATPTQFTSVPAGTAAANNVTPIKVTNIGDAPLVFTNAVAGARRQRRRRRQHDPRRLLDRQQGLPDKTLPRPRPPCRRSGDPATRPLRRPGRHLHDQRRLQADAHELHLGRPPDVRLELRRRDGGRAARRHEHGRRHQHRRRQRPEPAGAQPAERSRAASARSSRPSTKNYETAVAATVTSTAGDATLAVNDPGTVAPGHLVNGAFSLPSPLNVTGDQLDQPGQAYAPLRRGHRHAD